MRNDCLIFLVFKKLHRLKIQSTYLGLVSKPIRMQHFLQVPVLLVKLLVRQTVVLPHSYDVEVIQALRLFLQRLALRAEQLGLVHVVAVPALRRTVAAKSRSSQRDRWTNRASGRSVVRVESTTLLPDRVRRDSFGDSCQKHFLSLSLFLSAQSRHNLEESFNLYLIVFRIALYYHVYDMHVPIC